MTQWRTCFGGLVGLDYTAVQTVAGILCIRMETGLFRMMQTLESYELGTLKAEYEHKPCRGIACSMCTKTCPERVSEKI